MDAEFSRPFLHPLKIIVLGQVADSASVEDATVHSQLFRDVSSAVIMKHGFAIASPVVYDHKYAKHTVLTQNEIYEIFGASPSAARADVKKVTFWDADNSQIIDALPVLPTPFLLTAVAPSLTFQDMTMNPNLVSLRLNSAFLLRLLPLLLLHSLLIPMI